MNKLRKNSKKGLSPVIAAVILIAVTVAIAVAAGGYFFQIFGTQTSRAQVSVRTAQLVLVPSAFDCAGGVGTGTADLIITFQNPGGLADSVLEVSVPGTLSTTINAPPDVSILPNTDSKVITYCIDTPTYSTGQTVSFTIRLQSGGIIPAAVSVS